MSPHCDDSSPMNEAILPGELERTIFELAASLDPDCMPTLVLVARRVQIWIEPLLYRILTIHGLACVPQPKRTVLRHPVAAILRLIDTRPASFFSTHVRHVWLNGVNSTDAAEILSVCCGTTNLAFFNIPWNFTLVPILGTLPLQRLYVDQAQICPLLLRADPAHGMFQRITHLEVALSRTHLDWESWVALARMPRLTHLACRNGWPSSPMRRGVLEKCTGLKVMAAVYASGLQGERGVCQRIAREDARCMTVLVSDYMDDWECGAQGGRDYWMEADALSPDSETEKMKDGVSYTEW
ncbi:hypothetical protein C8R43DRAFT_210367 [Mycena crocata]|nr:hypothetical protein C8R43DRAFT_210367 [Mycena crocata]